MSALSNAKKERFAQGVAAGIDVKKAYVDAGFKPNNGNPYTLKKQKSVQSRIDELLEQRADGVIAKTASEILYTRETLLNKLEDAFKVADEKKNSVGMVQATIGMARILGLIIDRREVGDAGAFDDMTDEELVASAAKKARELGIEGPQLVEEDKSEDAA